MYTDDEPGGMTRKARWQFFICFTILWLATGWLIAQGEKWLVTLARTEDLQQGLVLATLMSIVTCVSIYLLINLYGAVLTIILPRRKLLSLQQKIVRYPFTMYILGKVIDHQLKLKDEA